VIGMVMTGHHVRHVAGLRARRNLEISHGADATGSRGSQSYD
jgi:hypothetical protein